MEKSVSPNAGTRRVLGLVFLTVFMDFLGFSVIFPVYPQLMGHYLATEREGSALHALLNVAQGIAGTTHPVAVAALFGGLLGAIFAGMQFLFTPVWGRLSDRFGRRPVLLATLAGTALAYALWAFAGSFTVLLCSRLLAGMMAGNISVAQAAAADVTSGRDRSKAMGLVGVAIALGMLCGPALCAISAGHPGEAPAAPSAGLFGLNPFSGVAAVSLLMASLNLAVAWFAFRETLPAERRSATGERRGSIFQLHRLESADIRRATVVNLLFFTAFAGMESTLTFATLDLFNYNVPQNTRMFVFIAVCMALVQGGIVRRMGARIGERRMVIGGQIASLAGFATLALAGTPGVFYAGLFLFTVAAGLTQPSLAALVSLYSDERSQGFHAGVLRSAGALARAVGPIAAALLYFKTGGHVAVYAAGAVLALTPLPLALRMSQPKHSHRA